MKKGMLKVKATLSILLLVDFIIVLVTGIMLYGNMGPANIGNLHTISGFLMGLIATLHIVLNFKMLIGEITGKVEIRLRQN